MTIPPENFHKYRVTVRLTPRQRDMLKELATTRDMPAAVLARYLVVSHLESLARKLPAQD